MQRKPRLLIIEDEPAILTGLLDLFVYHGYDVDVAQDGRLGLEKALVGTYDLIILDIMLPTLDGSEVLRAARAESDVAVLILSARGSTADRISGIASGADDYLPKPFSPAELVVRVKALLRRAEPREQPARKFLSLGDLAIDLDRHEVRRGGERIALTQSELSLLAALVRAGGRIVTREVLLDALYGKDEAEVIDRTVDVYIRRLRDKLGDDPDRPRYVATVRGAGYRALLGA